MKWLMIVLMAFALACGNSTAPPPVEDCVSTTTEYVIIDTVAGTADTVLVERD